ncbi:MAG TPA: hypothetical protein PLY19_07350, partial [Rhodoglobus sp.]|nr:hypothetical protein [Rhodoglobus sp.]
CGAGRRPPLLRRTGGLGASIASARAAGTTVIGIPFIVPIEEGAAHVLWPTLEGRTLADLGRVLATSAAM